MKAHHPLARVEIVKRLYTSSQEERPMTHRLSIAAILALAASLALLPTVTHATPPNVKISSDTSPYLQNEQQIWISPFDANIVIADWRDWQLGYRRVGVGVSTDGGATWSDSLFTGIPFDRQSDPCMTGDRYGNFYANMLNYNPGGIGESYIVVYRSTDNGVSWTGPVETCPWILGTFEDKQFTTVDRTGGPYDGNYYCSWTRFYGGSNRMIFVRSTDGCQTFDDTVKVGPSEYYEFCGGWFDAGQFSIPVVDADGDVHVFWQGYEVLDPYDCIFRLAIRHTFSTDGGVTFSEPGVAFPNNLSYHNVDGGVDVYGMPNADCDIFDGPYDNTIYVSQCQFADDAGGETDVTVRKSTDNGVTWTDRVVVNDDPPGQNIDQFHPWLVVNEDGVVLLIFYDQRNDPAHRKFDAYFSASFDGGETYITNMRISEVSSDPWDAVAMRSDIPNDVFEPDGTIKLSKQPVREPRAGLIAEYIGIHANNDTINTIWTDTRNGNQDCYGARFLMPFMKPRLYLPENADPSFTEYPTFLWATCWHEDQDSYRLELSTDPNFFTVDYLFDGLTDNEFVPPSPLVDQLYFWRVKAFKASGDSTEYSNTYFFGGEYTCIDSDGDWYGDPGNPENDCADDNCPSDFNPDQADPDEDGLGSVCDNCPGAYNPEQDDYDNDGAGDACDHFCGDADTSRGVDIDDVVYLIAYIFSGGPPPDPMEAGDVNCEAGVDIDDTVYLIAYIFSGGPEPCDPDDDGIFDCSN